ncbi:MAG: ketopantoate reductase C-terminal domain-containing protein [Terriglobales bacterium]
MIAIGGAIGTGLFLDSSLANALGITLDGDPKALVKKAAHPPGKHKASMVQDILAERPTEVDFMNGAISG